MAGLPPWRRWKKAARQLLRLLANPRLLAALLRHPGSRQRLLARCQALRLLGRAKGYAFQ
jgi:hypothetical protein